MYTQLYLNVIFIMIINDRYVRIIIMNIIVNIINVIKIIKTCIVLKGEHFKKNIIHKQYEY